MNNHIPVYIHCLRYGDYGRYDGYLGQDPKKFQGDMPPDPPSLTRLTADSYTVYPLGRAAF